MVATAVNPSAQGNGFTHLGFGHQTAIVGAHGHNVLSKRDTEGAAGLTKIYFNKVESGTSAAGATEPMEIT